MLMFIDFSFMQRFSNSLAQDFAFTAKSVKTCKLSQKNLPLAEGDLKWTDSVTGKPKAELLPLITMAAASCLRYEKGDLSITGRSPFSLS